MNPALRWLGRRHLVILAVATTLVVGACGGAPAGGTETASILSQVLQRGTLRVATITGSAPFESLDTAGNLVGYDIDIIKELADRMGVKIEFIQTDTAGRVTTLQSGKADVVVSSFTRTLKRSQVISFTDPINLEAVVLLVDAARSDLNQVTDLNKAGLRVAVPAGGTNMDAVQQVLPLATAVQVPGPADMLQAVISDKADAAAVANTSVGEFMKANPDKFKLIPGSLTAPQEDGIGLPIGDFTWWLYVNQFVRDINSDGTNYTTYQKWFGAGTTPGPFAVPPAGAAQ